MALFPLGILSAAGVSGFSSDYELISTTVLGTATSTINFSNLGDFSSTYRHLQIRMVSRQTGSFGVVSSTVQFNSDTGSNYAWHRLFAQSPSSVIPQASINQANFLISGIPDSNQAANAFGAAVVDILDFASNSKFKTVRALAGVTSTNSEIHLQSGLYRSTSPITAISLTAQSTAHAIGSRFSLYGIRG
jgi:hypothetical protein